MEYLNTDSWEVKEPKVKMYCDECKDELYEDDYYYELDDRCLCEDCYDSIMYQRKDEARKECSDY